ncbi:hypothetical protein, partial [Paracoccus marinaquae]
APAAPGLLPFTAMPVGAHNTPGLPKHHNSHSAKPDRGFVQSGFNEVAERAKTPPIRHATSQNPPD